MCHSTPSPPRTSPPFGLRRSMSTSFLPHPLQVDCGRAGPRLQLGVGRNDVFIERLGPNGGEVRGREGVERHMATPLPPHENAEIAKAIRFEIGVGHFKWRKRAEELSAVFLIAR